MANIRSKAISLAVILILGFSGCGSNGDNKATTDTEATTVEINGLVIDGDFEKTKVCLDSNLNSQCDTNEPSTTTSNDGTYSLTINESEKYNYPDNSFDNFRYG